MRTCACGHPLEDGSDFCPECGEKLIAIKESVSEATAEKAVKEWGEPETEEVASVRIFTDTSEEPRENFDECEEKSAEAVKTKKFWIVILSLVIVVLLLLYVGERNKNEELTRTVGAQEKTIGAQKKTIESHQETIASLEEKGDYYDTICEELTTGNVGYAASNFKSSESIIVVGKGETDRKFTLTANWSGGGTVYTDYSGGAASVSYDNNSWTTSTTMTVIPEYEGVTAVTFSNSVDSKTFKIIIIVTK